MAEESSIISDSIKEILDKYNGVFEVINEGKKLKCHLTNHEIALSLKSLEDYVEGKKFQRLFKKLKSPENYVTKVEEKYKDFFIPSRNSKSRLYCTLTKKEVNNLPHALEKYTSGYKFMKAFHFHKQKLLEGGGEKAGESICKKDETKADNCSDSAMQDPFYAISDEEYPDDIEIDEEGEVEEGTNSEELIEEVDLDDIIKAKDNWLEKDEETRDNDVIEKNTNMKKSKKRKSSVKVQEKAKAAKTFKKKKVTGN